MRVIAEGIGTEEEKNMLLEMGIYLHQGYNYAKPEFETLPRIALDLSHSKPASVEG